MWAQIERFDGGCVRVFDESAKYGDPFSYSIQFAIVGPREIEFKGVKEVPTPSQARAILRAVRAAGWTARRERKSGANPGTKTFR